MLFILTAVLSSFALADFTPIPPGQLAALGKFFNNSVVPLVNTDIGTKLNDSIPKVTSGAVVNYVNLGVCNASAGARFDITNLSGLHTIQLDSLALISGNMSTSPRLLALQLAGVLGPFSLVADVSGQASASCGIFQPVVGISGVVRVENATMSLMADTTITNDGKLTVVAFAVDTVNFDAQDILVDIGTLDFFNSMLHAVEKAVENRFRSQIDGIADNFIKTELQDLISQKLPFKIMGPN